MLMMRVENEVEAQDKLTPLIMSSDREHSRTLLKKKAKVCM